MNLSKIFSFNYYYNYIELADKSREKVAKIYAQDIIKLFGGRKAAMLKAEGNIGLKEKSFLITDDPDMILYRTYAKKLGFDDKSFFLSNRSLGETGFLGSSA
ncbi:hypothetical protein [Okeania sp.]|uniref:hypothetical protein n=1 Tax=Okeania sp. TaxID=3100323 RepID=UPI002B4B265F|nr:hypothetical protein [Okeania sp.]MEB3341054.1 hypothetical protein [Okeania sp.]